MVQRHGHSWDARTPERRNAGTPERHITGATAGCSKTKDFGYFMQDQACEQILNNLELALLRNILRPESKSKV